MIRIDQWSPPDGLTLERNARRAVKETGRNVALTAGPGAGKTELLAQRADFLFQTGYCRYPKRILAIAFKVDASHNLKARVRMRCGSELASRLDSYTFHAFAKRIIDRFRPFLTGQDALDPDYSIGPNRIQNRVITFADIIPLATTIITGNVIARNALRQTYSHVFLDEFQDCTNAQYQFIKRCFHSTNAKITAVGDTKQRIMGWAGALEGIFQTYAADFNCVSFNLYQNFRSQPRLRRMQNSMVRIMDAAAAVDDEDIPGDEGEIEILDFANDDVEAADLATRIKGWIDDENIDPSEIAILVSKQQNLYCQKLRAAFVGNGVRFREEDTTQDLASEPVATLIVDFLLVTNSAKQPLAYKRLLETIVFSRGLDDEQEYQARLALERFVTSTRDRIADGSLDVSDEDHLAQLVRDFIGLAGRDVVVSLSSEYARGDRLDQLVVDTIARSTSLLQGSGSRAEALASFSGDSAVRIMSIHKSKGLEFEVVVVLGVEHETFWGELEAERSAYFVAISRAKRRLVLTVCDRRSRPSGAARWNLNRTEHTEFLEYARQYID